MRKKNVYDNFLAACDRKGVKITNVLKDLGCSTGVTGGWKSGQSPRLDIVMKIAEYLNVSLDDLCYGVKKSHSTILDDNQREWLNIIENIPTAKQDMCKDFLKTHAMIPEKTLEKTS